MDSSQFKFKVILSFFPKILKSKRTNIFSPLIRHIPGVFFLLLLTFTPYAFFRSATRMPQNLPPQRNLLQLLGISPSPESIDYVQNKTQFQLHNLLTEQRHPKTWNLSEVVRQGFLPGLKALLAVDEDITKKLENFSYEMKTCEELTKAFEESFLGHKKIYIYGCGATGRLAKQMESSFWRPFWKKIKSERKIWTKLKTQLGESIEDRLMGEMTGADKALISSLEGLEDLQLIGRLQLEEKKIKKGDLVICVTEGGETSSVIGTILAALDLWKKEGNFDPLESRKSLYFIYNNPDSTLLPLERSRRVIEEPGISKINLTTGPQAISGSTRMQATTIETFVIGTILETALERTLRKFLTKKEMSHLGFESSLSLEERLGNFPNILNQLKKSLPSISLFTEMEAKTYEEGHFTTYFANRGLITVFIDSTERSPTFRLLPLDTVKEKQRRCWVQLWTSATNLQEAWEKFLGRTFRGLSSAFYERAFEEEIEDPFLKKAALESLKNAGDDQQFLYDFSLSESNLSWRGPKAGDLGVCVLISPEEKELEDEHSHFRDFLRLFIKEKARIAGLAISDKSYGEIEEIIKKILEFNLRKEGCLVVVNVSSKNDPFHLNQQIALKMLLNAHSTAVMTYLGRVIGNTMTNVSPSNLKLVGRATYLVQSHVNDILVKPQWIKRYGLFPLISYGEANAVLFESIAFLKQKKDMTQQTAEVALSIIRILESIRLQEGISNERALEIVKNQGLRNYLLELIEEK